MTDDQITPGERRELRSVVRSQMKVLRAEVKQRAVELEAEADARLVEKYRDEDRRADELGREITKIRDDANRQLREALTQFEDLAPDGRWSAGTRAEFYSPTVYRRAGDRKQLREAIVSGINVQVRQALLALDRQEADLLRELAVDGLQTAAARAFLGRIPTVAELVPAQRLREIESTFDTSKRSGA